MANAVDSKSTGSDILRVQVPFWAPFKMFKKLKTGDLTILFFFNKFFWFPY